MTRTFLDAAKDKFRVWDQTCLSYGPCQTPTLWFCVQRHKEIEKFKKQDTFAPKVTVSIEGFPVDLTWVEEKTMDAKRAKQVEGRLANASTAVFKELRVEKK